MPDVVLPVLDEAGAIASVLESLPIGYRAIVVDNGSTDGSGDIAARLGAVVVHEPRRGFGAACASGLAAATADIVCFMDCDGSLAGSDLTQLVALVESDAADLAIGERCASFRAWPLHARIANRGLARLVRRRTGTKLRDLGPSRAARRDRLVALGIEDRRSGWPLEMVLRAAKGGWRITGVPVDYLPRIGKSKVTGTVRGTMQAVRDMHAVAEAFR